MHFEGHNNEQDNKQQKSTNRPVVEKLEEILNNKIPVLDHGFIRVIDYMGNDDAIVQAARVSYGKGTKTINQDQGLINYLMRNKHTTPFEMCDIKFHIKLPIFVARQWIRHRTASINEYSARYSILSNEFYIPKISNISKQSMNNKQGRTNHNLSLDKANQVLEILKTDSETCYKNYINMLNENSLGVSRELARINLPVNFYTELYWKINLHNLLHFLSLRITEHAQYEIRVYAKAIFNIIKLWVPKTCFSFEEYTLYGKHISRKAINVIKSLIKGEKITFESSGINKREWNELMDLINSELISTKNN